MNPLIPGIDEETDQILFVNWVNRNYPLLAPCLHHSPNGGYRDSRTGLRMKLMGTKPGFHDLVLFHPVGRHTGLAIEMKIGKGRMSQAQHDWTPRFQACGFRTHTCWGVDEAKAVFLDYVEGGT